MYRFHEDWHGDVPVLRLEGEIDVSNVGEIRTRMRDFDRALPVVTVACHEDLTASDLVGRYLLYDALEGSFREVHLRRDPECPMCGEHPTISEYIDYEGFCASPAEWRSQHTPAKVSTPAE